MDKERELVGSLMALQDPQSRNNAAKGTYDLRVKIDEAERELREARNLVRASGVSGEEYVAMRRARRWTTRAPAASWVRSRPPAGPLQAPTAARAAARGAWCSSSIS